MRNLRLFGEDKQAELAPANKAKTTKTHLSKERIKLWFFKKDPKAGSADPEAKFKALKWLISTFSQLSEEHTLCGGGDKQAATA